MALIDDIKKVLRVTTTSFDTEITDLINAAKLDLDITGVDTIVETDALVKRAITLYCKANFGYDNIDADRLAQSYLSLKQHLSVSADYHTYGDE